MLSIADHSFSNKKIVLFGAGIESMMIGKYVSPQYMVDLDSSKWNRYIMNAIIFPPVILQREIKDDLLIIVSSPNYQEAANTLSNMGFTENVHFVDGMKHFEQHIRRDSSLYKHEFLQAAIHYRMLESSPVPIDVLIPVILKDLDTLAYAIAFVRQNVKHPLGEIIIVAPDLEEIKHFCAEQNCKFIHEDTVLPITKHDIDYLVNGLDRSGWIFKQLINYCGDRLCSQDYFLVIDADTLLIRPHVFLCNDKTLFNYSDEFHIPYFRTYEKLLGEKTRVPFSFISHYMLFQKDVLAELKRTIERVHHVPWYEAIINQLDRSEGASFADYETYGNFYYSRYEDNVLLDYWNNLSLKQHELNHIGQLDMNELSKAYKSLSFHSHNYGTTIDQLPDRFKKNSPQ